MSISAPPGQPSILQTLSSSFRDAGGLLKRNAIPSAILIVIGTAIAFSVNAKGNVNSTLPAGVQALIFGMDLVLVVLSYYAIAAAVRTIHAEYRMTVGQFFGILGYSILVGLLTCIAAIFFVIPAYWVGVKLAVTPYAYALGARDPLKTAWHMTTGYYWQTLGMLLLAGVCIGLIACAAIVVAAFAMTAAPVLGAIVAALALLVLAWAVHVQALVYVRWTDALLPRANMPSYAVPAPA
ncbi:MAG TPA: hypothetical protein VIO32_04075 [Candidatus Baltobacteraceae bacterium]